MDTSTGQIGLSFLNACGDQSFLMQFFSSLKMLIETGTLRFIDFSILDRFYSMYVMFVLCTVCSLKMIPSLFMTVIIVIRNFTFLNNAQSCILNNED